MIYIVILLIFLLWLGERSINNGRLSPTSVMCSVWGVTLILVSFFQHDLFYISGETQVWILAGVFAFFVGGILSKPLSIINIKPTDVFPIGILAASPLYALMIFLSLKMSQDGLAVNENFYIGIRTIINYGEPSWYFSAFGYLYYLIYPVFFISAVSYYMKQNSSFRKRTFIFHGVMALFYAVVATAKVKLLMIFITWILIRSYYKKTSTKLILGFGLSFLAIFFISLLALNKISGGNSVLELAIASIGNYSIANVFALDSLNFMTIPSSLCINSGPDCVIMPFYDIGYFHTNVYTFIYDFFDSGIFFFSGVMLAAGFIHNSLHKMAKSGGNPFLVIISSLLYFPLVYQIINNQYTSSKYLIYLTVITFAIYYVKRVPLMPK